MGQELGQAAVAQLVLAPVLALRFLRGGATEARGGPVCGTTFGPTYGDYDQPNLLGSAGGSSGSFVPYDGGSVVIRSTGAVVIDGVLRSTGRDVPVLFSGQSAGGGAGGSIWIDAQAVSGIGVISVVGGKGNGGSTRAGGGGGGRIRLDSSLPIPTTLQAQAWGGLSIGIGIIDGGAGTVLMVEGGVSSFYLRNNGYPDAETEAVTPIIVDSMVIGDGAVLSTPRLGRLLARIIHDLVGANVRVRRMEF